MIFEPCRQSIANPARVLARGIQSPQALTRLTLMIAVVGALTMTLGCSRPEPAAEPVRAVRTMTLASDSAGAAYVFAAEVKPRTESRLGFRVGGKIVRRDVDVGASVKAGQVLAQLDPQDLRLGQDAARAALAAAQVNLDQAAADFKRFRDLKEQGFISAAELERRESTLKAAKAQLEQARAQVGLQGNQTTYAALHADAAGTITAVEAEPGMVVGAGATVVRLAHDGPRDAVFAVPEDKVALVKALASEAGAFKVTLWGDSGPPRTATIREIAASADPLTRTYAVRADIGRGGDLQLGQTASVTMTLPRVEGLTRLPLAALKEDKGRTVVWLVDRQTMQVSQRPVKVEGAEGNDAVISAGLAPGDVVVTAGVHVLNPGQKVKFYVEAGTPPAASATATQ